MESLFTSDVLPSVGSVVPPDRLRFFRLASGFLALRRGQFFKT